MLLNTFRALTYHVILIDRAQSEIRCEGNLTSYEKGDLVKKCSKSR